MDDVDRRRKRAALNQSLFRDVNERISALSSRFGGELQSNAYVCECLSTDCSAILELPHAVYERVRGSGTTFFVLPGHEDPVVEDVVERTDRYLVVEKIGAGAETADSMDPRKIESVS